MPSQKGEVELAKEDLIKAVNQVLGIVRRNGRSRKVGLALVLMVLLGGRASVRNAAETFGLDYANLLEALGELHDAWRDYLESLPPPERGVLQSQGLDVPVELLDLPPHPPGLLDRLLAEREVGRVEVLHV